MSADTFTCPWYLRKAYDVDMFSSVVAETRKILLKYKVAAVAATGHSGLPLAGALAATTKLSIIAVRRYGHIEVGHNRPPDYVRTAKEPWRTYAIVDDLMETGTTIAHIIHQIWCHRIVMGVLPKVVVLYATTRSGTKFQYDRLWIQRPTKKLRLSDIVFDDHARQILTPALVEEARQVHQFTHGVPIEYSGTTVGGRDA